MKILTLLVMLLFSSRIARAAQANVACQGKIGPNQINVQVHVHNILDFNSGVGFIAINNAIVSQFVGPQVHVNAVFLTMRGQNGVNDSFHAHITNLEQGYGVVDQLSLPSKNLHLTNLPMECSLEK